MNKESNLVEAYQKIERMIQLTSDLFDELVENQGQSIKIHYPEQIICISLVRLKYPDGRCRGVFWEKFHIEGKNLFWRKGWKLENTPASSLVKRMEEGDKVKFRKLHNYAKSIKIARKDLVKKKLRILSTAQEVKAFEQREMQRLEEKYEQFLRRTSR